MNNANPEEESSIDDLLVMKGTYPGMTREHIEHFLGKETLQRMDDFVEWLGYKRAEQFDTWRRNLTGLTIEEELVREYLARNGKEEPPAAGGSE